MYQFDSAPPSANKKEEATRRAMNLNDDALIKLIERTPEDTIIHT